MQFTFWHICLASVLLTHASDGFRILGIFPWPAKSHFSCNNAIMKSLIDTGHEVTVITSFPKHASAENYSSIIDVSEEHMIRVGRASFDEWTSQNPFKLLDKGIKVIYPYCSKILNLPEIQRILNSDEKLYDVVFVEILFFYKCFLPVVEKMNIPFIGTTTVRTCFQADHAIYNPHHPAYIPYEVVTQKWKLEHILGRINNVWNYIVASWHENVVFPKMLKQFHDDHIDQLSSLEKYMTMEPDLIFYNNHASLLPRPMNPNAIEIGGVHVEDAKPLPKNFQEFIDEAEHGAILFALGSFVRAATLTLENQKAFRDAFAEIPQRVIWKFEEKMDNLSSNVMILDWVPQRDILEHENVIAFISHCGLGSMNEAVYTATPVVACPLFFDQPDNAELLENLGVAVHLDIYDITKENVLYALNAVINDTKYYNNMQKLSTKFKDRPMTSQQSVVYWTEYVIRHQGASHLKSPATRLSWFQFLMFDVILIVAVVLIIFMCLLSCACRILSSYCISCIGFLRTFNKLKTENDNFSEHQNVIAFISHCGLGGTNEAAYTATPVIACPLFADQLDNAKLLEDHGVAVHLDFHDITKENILNALNAVINNTSYRDNMRKLSNKFKDRPMTPQQSVVYWTEYVIRHQGASHLRSPASRLSWLQFFMLDVIFIVTTVLVIFVLLFYFIIRICLSNFVKIRCFNQFKYK
ncbi:UDP-glucosyltransferase 2-like [Planococcus citri]|uniref:UDP-glucosyltransferase 2-like n=1 Tax=Planococcus citri TaxID=170843 RepID=UPI0031F88899